MGVTKYALKVVLTLHSRMLGGGPSLLRETAGGHDGLDTQLIPKPVPLPFELIPQLSSGLRGDWCRMLRGDPAGLRPKLIPKLYPLASILFLKLHLGMLGGAAVAGEGSGGTCRA